MNQEDLAKAFTIVGDCKGLSFDGEDIVINGRYVDAYLLVAVTAMRLQSGDIQIVEKSDSIGKKWYFDRLLNSISKL